MAMGAKTPTARIKQAGAGPRTVVVAAVANDRRRVLDQRPEALRRRTEKADARWPRTVEEHVDRADILDGLA
jgi:hypothetical protein